ncbi:MAG TPA: hypothetical protein VIA98_03100 [Allosphingosinicella sp.]|jgi:hypothetical protein
MAEDAFPTGYAIFCDDIRHEINGKVTLVGTYFNEMIFSGVEQGYMPVLHLLVCHRFPASERPRQVGTRVLFCANSGEDIPMLEDMTDVPATLPPAPLLARPDMKLMFEVRRLLRMSPVFFPSSGVIRVRGIYDGEEHRVGGLSVVIRPAAA